jgi:hypothetical protein
MADKSDKVRAKVVGTCEVAGTRPGGTVDLDPDEVNIPALVEAGHIEISKSAAARVASSAPEG